MNLNKITAKREDGVTILRVVVPKSAKNIASCDIFVDEHNLLFCCDNFSYRYYTPSKIDTKDLRELEVKLNTAALEYSFRLPFLPDETTVGKIQNDESPVQIMTQALNILEMRRGTETCAFTIDGVTHKFDDKFSYGFACRFQDDTSLLGETLGGISNISNPSKFSPIQRCYQRETDERKDFCRDQYKLNFVELHVPEGFENPAKFVFNCNDNELNTNQAYTLKTLTETQCHITDEIQSFVDCGLIELLLAICYDVRSTQNETNCESAWTRSILSAMFTYFEPIANLRTIVEIFLRRSLTYPLYRNYDLSRLCVEDAIVALQKGPKWILKQLLITYDLFLSSDSSRSLFNKYFIEDYIRYMTTVDGNHLRTLSRNLKNIHLNFTKKDLRLGLSEIETELLKELINDIHLGHSDDSDEEDVEDEESSEGGESSSDENAE